MKLTSSGRTQAAGMTRSPSFSRSSSSMMTAILPWRRSPRISSIVLNPDIVLVLASGGGHEPRQVARDHVDFHVDAVAGAQFTERRRLVRVGNDIDTEFAAIDLVDGQADAIEADRALRRGKARELRGQRKTHPP